MFYDQLFTRSQCNYCQQEIPGMGIECCECTITPHVRLCAECFSLGAEMGPHKADHRYRFFDSGSLQIFPPKANIETDTKDNDSKGSTTSPETETTSSWSARADIRLLDAIEQYGFGNWQDISKHVESKSSAEAKDEYVSRFVTGVTGQATWRAFPFNSEEPADKKTKGIQRPIDHTLDSDDSPLSPGLSSKLPPLDISSDEVLQLGYMPDRDDYEKEYDNEAEKLVSQLAFNPEDDDAEIGLKLSLVDMYSRRLRERVRRKRVIRDYQLVSLFFKKDRTNANKEGTGTRRRFAAYEKELTERLRHLSHFHTAREHDNFIKNFLKEKELKFRIQELYKYRKNGIKREEDCIEYEKHKLSVMRKNKLLNNKSTASATETVDNKKSIPPVISEEGVIVKPKEEGSCHANSFDELNIGASQPPFLMGGTMMVMEEMGMDLTDSMMETSMMYNFSGLLIEKDDVNGVSCYPGKSPILPRSYTEDFSLSFEGLPSDLLSSPVTEKQPKSPEVMPQLSIPVPIPESEPDFHSLSPPVEKPKDTEDQSTANICLMPSSFLLSSSEESLCLNMNLLPSQYMTIKTALLMNPEEELPRPSNFDVDQWDTIVNFMSHSGWVPVAAPIYKNYCNYTSPNIATSPDDIQLEVEIDLNMDYDDCAPTSEFVSTLTAAQLFVDADLD